MIINGDLKFHTLGSGELQNAVMENLTTALRTASNGVSGQLVYDTDIGAFFFSTGAAWVQFGSSGAVGTLQTEVDAIETSLGTELVDGSGVFNTTDANLLGNVSGATDLYDVLQDLDSAISLAAGVDTMGELTDAVATVTSNAVDGDLLFFDGTNWDNTGFSATPNDNDLLQFNTTGNIWEPIAPSTIGGNAYETITTDVGTSIVADQVSDTASLTGGTNGGIQTTAAADAITVDWVMGDLATETAATIAPADFLTWADSTASATTVGSKITWTKALADLDVVSLASFSSAHLISRTADDTYAEVTLAVDGPGANDGLVLTNGALAAGAITFGLDINGTPAEGGTLSNSDLFIIYDGTNNVKATLQQVADGISAAAPQDLNDLNNVTDGTTAGHVLYADSGTTWATALPGATSNVQAHGDALDDFNVIGVTTAADQMYYSTAAGTLALTTVTSAGRALIDDATVGDQRTTLGLVAGGAGDIWVEKAGDTMSGALNMGSQLITNVAAPVSGTDAANKTYVDSNIAGLTWKDPVIAASTANIVLATGGLLTIDGVGPLTAGDRVLVKDQTAPAENGIYVVAAGAWTRSTDLDSLSPIDEVNSAAVFVQQGTLNSDIGYTVTSTVATLGTDAITWAAFTGAAAVVDGVGLTFTGNVLDINLGAGIAALPSDEVGIDLFSATSALIITNDGSTRTELTGDKLHLLLATTGGLEQDVNGLRVDVNNTTTATIAVADELLFADSTNADVPSKTTVTNFLADLNIATTASGGALSASNGVELTSNDFAVSIDSLTLTTTVVGADLLILDDGATGTNIGRTVTNFLADLDIVNSLGGNGIAVQNGTDSYVNRSIAVSVVGGDEGISIVDGDGVSGDPTVGLDIVGLTAAAVAVAEITDVTTPIASGMTTGESWSLSSTSLDYYVWYNKDAGGGDPAPAGKTGIEVAITNGDSAIVVATATAAAINALGAFSAPNSGTATLTVTNAVAGAVTDAADVDAAVVVSVTTQGVDVVSSTDTLVMYDGTNNVKVTMDDIGNAVSGVTSTEELTDVNASATASGHTLVADGVNNYVPVHTHFVSTQASATTWTVTHNLNQQFVQVTVYDSSNNVIIPQTIVATSATVTTITFNTAINGTAVCSGVVGAASESV